MKRYLTYALSALCLLASFSGVVAFEDVNNHDEIQDQENAQERVEPLYLAMGLTVVTAILYQFSRQKPELEPQGEFLTDILERLQHEEGSRIISTVDDLTSRRVVE